MKTTRGENDVKQLCNTLSIHETQDQVILSSSTDSTAPTDDPSNQTVMENCSIEKKTPTDHIVSIVLLSTLVLQFSLRFCSTRTLPNESYIDGRFYSFVNSIAQGRGRGAAQHVTMVPYCNWTQKVSEKVECRLFISQQTRDILANGNGTSCRLGKSYRIRGGWNCRNAPIHNPPQGEIHIKIAELCFKQIFFKLLLFKYM